MNYVQSKNIEPMEFDRIKVWGSLAAPGPVLLLFLFQLVRIGGAEVYVDAICNSPIFLLSQIGFWIGLFTWVWLFSRPAYQLITHAPLFLDTEQKAILISENSSLEQTVDACLRGNIFFERLYLKGQIGKQWFPRIG